MAEEANVHQAKAHADVPHSTCPTKNTEKKQALITGPLLPTLVKFTIPIALTIFFQMGYATADLLILGQFGTIADLSGATVGGRLLQLIMTFFIGLALGATILVGQYIGKKKFEDIGKIVGTSIIVYGLIGFAVTGILIYFAHDIIAILKTPPEAVEHAYDYLVVCAIGIIFIVQYNLFGCIYRGLGDSKTPLIVVAIGCFINIILDIIFIIFMDLGAMGAAIGTMSAQGCSIVCAFFLVKKQGFPYKLSRKDFVIDIPIAKALLKLGTPAAIQSALVNVSFLAITKIINEFGLVASASVGIVERIAGIIVIVPLAFMQGISAFTAQNNAAQQFERTKQGLKYALIISTIFGSITGYIGYFHGTVYTSLFTSDPATTASALEYLKSYAIDCLLVSIMFTMNGYFSGCGKTAFVMMQGIFGAFALRVPLAYLFSSFENTSLFIIGLATPAATFSQLFISFSYFYYYQKQLKQTYRIEN